MFCGDLLRFCGSSSGGLILPVCKCFKVMSPCSTRTTYGVMFCGQKDTDAAKPSYPEFEHWGVNVAQCQPHLRTKYVSAAEPERDREERAECQGEGYPLSLVSRGKNVSPRL